jgi:hypothetical protein
MRGNPQLNAIALLVKRFGERIPGGFEVRVSALELTEMSPHGTFQEVPDLNGRGVRWRYFPNDQSDVIDLKPEDWTVTKSDAIVKVEKKDAE